jgi:hypothetical protein
MSYFTGHEAGRLAHARSRIGVLSVALCLLSTLGCAKNLSGTYKADLIEVQGAVKLPRPSTITLARKDGDTYTVTVSGDSFIAQSGCALEIDQVGDGLFAENRMGLGACNSTDLRLFLDVTVIGFDTTGSRTDFELRGNMYTNAKHTFAPVPYRLVTQAYDVDY